MNRREFGSFFSLGLLATSLPVAIAACTPKETSADAPETEAAIPPETPTSRPDGFETLGTVADLDSQGYLSSKELTGGPVIVVRDSTEGVVALSSVCTHQGCTVEWKDDAFVCPCHGSKFDADGSVAVGPATDALSVYEATIEGDWVLVKAV
ncbi:Rieske (2Fe-2S) protein [Leptolyngbya cf. ectocarpi LEGE 11479]|uniref:Rieske (2Fe-2S) protein n=1 Tax=Leptolyngbya cf. ectocarpi LEGE 11479 TaxID=1828722 RepID=A0A928ZVS4_LEPEC|nr:Rieske (2Fe-2S) protein [Leptolyngbya ectocarpi]MBE9068328.1 Rieske (2Fe-2S) protein [Leptolyngbya cf. ectocarpi LEGE 11479]